MEQGKGVPVRGQHQVGMGLQWGLDPGCCARCNAGSPVRARLGEGLQGQVRGQRAVSGHEARVPVAA